MRSEPQQRKYVAMGVYPDNRPDARVEFPTLGAALAKLRDWVEADEIDDNGPMFCRYMLVVDPPIPSPDHDEVQQDGLPSWESAGPFCLPT